MICNWCAAEADWRTGPLWPGPSGKTNKPLFGHEACRDAADGCTCQHREVKEGQINGS